MKAISVKYPQQWIVNALLEFCIFFHIVSYFLFLSYTRLILEMIELIGSGGVGQDSQWRAIIAWSWTKLPLILVAAVSTEQCSTILSSHNNILTSSNINNLLLLSFLYRLIDCFLLGWTKYFPITQIVHSRVTDPSIW